jgi:hypothetical protein
MEGRKDRGMEEARNGREEGSGEERDCERERDSV